MNKNLLRVFLLNYNSNKICQSMINRLNHSNVNLAEPKKRLVDYLEEKASTNTLKYYDPPYLSREAPFPNYAELNLNFKGYDYISLNVFYKFVEKMCKSLNIEVLDSYPVPAQSLKVKTLLQFSSKLDKEYDLNIYHRVVRVKSIKSTMAPLLFEIVQLNLPEGVQMSVTVPTVEEDDYRYVPDIELNELRERLDEYSKKPKEVLEAEAAAAKQAATPQAAAAVKAPATKAPATTAAKPGAAAPAAKAATPAPKK